MTEKQCCSAMTKAIELGFVEVAITNLITTKARPSLMSAIIIRNPDRRKKAPLMLNFCPWCGTELSKVSP